MFGHSHAKLSVLIGIFAKCVQAKLKVCVGGRSGPKGPLVVFPAPGQVCCCHEFCDTLAVAWSRWRLAATGTHWEGWWAGLEFET